MVFRYWSHDSLGNVVSKDSQAHLLFGIRSSLACEGFVVGVDVLMGQLHRLGPKPYLCQASNVVGSTVWHPNLICGGVDHCMWLCLEPKMDICAILERCWSCSVARPDNWWIGCLPNSRACDGPRSWVQENW